MIRTIYFNGEGVPRVDVQPSDVPKLLEDRRSLVWMDFQSEPVETSEPVLREIFGFHPLAIDDALQDTHVPKLDDWDNYLYIVLADIKLDRTSEAVIDTLELDVFVGKQYIVTHHDDEIAALDRVWEYSKKTERHLKHGGDHVLYRISDELMTDYMHVVEGLDDEIELIENQVFGKPNPRLIERTFALKRSTAYLRRTVSPLREVFNKLARDEFSVIDQEDKVYFRDVYDHLVRLHDITEGLRDLVGGVLDTYLSVVNNRMNDIMKTLTVITTLFMPISFISGFFGMNFFQPVAPQLEPWTNLFAFVIMMAIMIGTPAFMLVWMRNRGWMS
jgi:magnesium transporter